MRIPISTYRLQFMPNFGFRSAERILGYLNALGISDIYASPIFKAKAGSLHGYDVIDPNQINPEIGGIEGYNQLVKEVKNHGMGWLQDIVPNHTAFDGENQMLMDVFENGPCSPFFDYFDIEWNHPYGSARGKVLAPFLGRFYAECLENGEIKLKYDQAGLSINYSSLRFPLRIESYGKVFDTSLAKLKQQLGGGHPDFLQLLGVLYVLRNLPSQEDTRERQEQISFVKRMLWELHTGNPQIRRFIDENVAKFKGQQGKPESFDRLDDLHSEQFFRLAFWKVATEEIDYRRFFHINGLISLRAEDEKVFHQTHSLVAKLVGEDRITGLRIDHVDGLYDPANYLKRLRTKVGEVYIVVEKVLAVEEELAYSWPIQGTTGYDYLNCVNGVFCERKNARKFDKLYTKFSGIQTPYEDLVLEKKRLIIGKHAAGDIDRFAQLMRSITMTDRYGSDITLYGLKRALVEVLAFFPIYRTYVSPEVYSETDRAVIRQVVSKAKKAIPGLVHELTFIERSLLLESRDHPSDEQKNKWVHLIMRMQQLTAPVMAKGFEDTVLYVFNRLLSLNEVGGSPNRFGSSVGEFHDLNRRRASDWPHGMNATSTHDTKRGEDVRARINVLSEMPEEWERRIKTWSKINRNKKKNINGKEVPDRNDEYALYQTLIGAFPFDESDLSSFAERIKEYVVKAVREAKVHTAWLQPDTDYETAFVAFVHEILAPSAENRFLREFLPFQKRVAYYGILNSLSQSLLKTTSPGVPDFYQGTELWDFNLVDPDNRCPVDYEQRKNFLEQIRERERTGVLDLVTDLLLTKEDGRIKLFLIYRALRARRDNLEVFERGDYIPLKADGQLGDHVVAFARKSENLWSITVAPRLMTSVVQEGEYPIGHRVWQGTCIVMPEDAPTLWKNAITAQVVTCTENMPIAEALGPFPVALLVGEKKA